MTPVTPRQLGWLCGLFAEVAEDVFQQLRWLWSAVAKTDPDKINRETVKAGLQGVALKDGLSELGTTAKLYLALLGLDKEVTQPAEKEGFETVTTMARGINAPDLVEAIRAMGVTVYVDGDAKAALDPKLVIEPRTATKTYAIRHRGRVAADEELKGRSANDLVAAKVEHMGLAETLVFWVEHWLATKQPLDLNTATITSARDLDGRVWIVYWHGGPLYVHRHRAGLCLDDWRGREVSF